MSSGLPTSSPAIVSAFQTALLVGFMVGLAIAVGLGVVWVITERYLPVRARSLQPQPSEPRARRFLRVAFGLLWLFDGILQAQPQMPLGLTSRVIASAASGSPAWLQHVVGWAGLVWNEHPVAAAASAVWIQVGIGLWLLVAPRGRWSQAGGVVSIAWGLAVWVFGEAMGGILTPGVTWLFGAPGAVLIYVVAGALIALPERAWSGERLGRTLVVVIGLFFLTMAFLQTLPGTGFWQAGRSGALAAMVGQMSQTAQPAFLSSWLAAFSGFTASHAVLMNLLAVAWLGTAGATLLAGISRSAVSPHVLLGGIVLAIILCVGDWVFVQDLGFLGGVGTDLNTAIPTALLCAGGYLAVRHPAPALTERSTEQRGWATRSRQYRLGVFAAASAFGLTLVGTVPAAYAAVTQPASPILAQSVGGGITAVDGPAPNFSLVDQRGRTVSLTGLRGKTVLLTFLDPVCTTDCPLIAQEFRQVDSEPGINAHKVVLVAIVANPLYYTASFTRAFTHQENLENVPNWHYLTGSPEALQQVQKAYGFVVSLEPAGAMIAHSDYAYVIGPDGRTRDIVGTDPGPGTTSTQASFATMLADVVKQVSG